MSLYAPPTSSPTRRLLLGGAISVTTIGLGVMQHGLWLMRTSRAAGHYRWPVAA